MKIDRGAKTATEAGESVQSDSQTHPLACGDERLAHQQQDLMLCPASGSLPDEAAAEGWTAKVKKVAETRHWKVASIKDAIQRGNYRISLEQTAEAIISEMEARANHHNLADEETNKMAEPFSTGRGPAGFASEPRNLYPRRKGSPKRR